MQCRQVFKDGRAVIPFLTCGYPDLETSEKLICALDEAGVDLIMLGIPFSDAVGEGPILRRASEVALKGGVTTDRIFDLLAQVRKKTAIPLALKTYANIVFAYGTERFVQNAAEHRVNALILLDVPFEEQTEFKGVCDAYGISLISFVATTTEDRVAQIVGQAQGFIYLDGALTGRSLRTLRQFTSLPVVARNGGSRVETDANGIVLETEIMELVGRHGKDAPQVVSDYARQVVASLKDHSHLKKRIATPMHTTMMAVKIASSKP